MWTGWVQLVWTHNPNHLISFYGEVIYMCACAVCTVMCYQKPFSSGEKSCSVKHITCQCGVIYLTWGPAYFLLFISSLSEYWLLGVGCSSPLPPSFLYLFLYKCVNGKQGTQNVYFFLFFFQLLEENFRKSVFSFSFLVELFFYYNVLIN